MKKDTYYLEIVAEYLRKNWQVATRINRLPISKETAEMLKADYNAGPHNLVQSEGDKQPNIHFLVKDPDGNIIFGWTRI